MNARLSRRSLCTAVALTLGLAASVSASAQEITLKAVNAFQEGTYFAKNLALTLAQGRFVFFQDGDDLCHPERLRLMMDRLMQPLL